MNCEGEHDIMWMNFNQDGTSLSAGAKAGFYLYGLSNATEKLDVRNRIFSERACLKNSLIGNFKKNPSNRQLIFFEK